MYSAASFLLSSFGYTAVVDIYSDVQESFSLTTKYQINVSKDDSERVDSLRFSWEKLNALAVSRSEVFVAMQYSSFSLLTQVLYVY